ncbi:serine protease, partial [Streptacidiphilus pinicola]
GAGGREWGHGPGALRRSAATVGGRCHEAARRMLGAADGGLTAREFDELFPWAEGWAQAALGEGLFVAAGAGYRFASGALADWLQGFHLDLPVALTMILADTAPPPVGEESLPRPVGAHRRGGPVGWAPPVPVPGQPTGGGVPRWRLAVVRQALLGLGETDPQALESLLSRLVLCLDGPDAAAPGSEARWWAERLLSGTLQRLPDAGTYAPLLRALAARVVYTAGTASPAAGDAEPFLPWDFWRALPLTVEARLDVLRVLVRSGAEEAARLLAGVLVQDPGAALPLLCGWLADERVSGIAAETLFEQRHVALDELTDALVDAAHSRADALLRGLAQAEPSALGRAVDRWAHDPRPERHVAAATLLPLLARHAAEGAAAERTLVRLAAEALLARADEEALHGAAYAALVCDPQARPRHLVGAVTRYLAGDPLLGAAALVPALDSDPALVLAGYAGRMREPGEEAAAVLRALGATAAPRARAAAARLVREHLQRRPETAAQVGGWVRARLAHGPAERETLLAFARDAAAEQPEPVRWRIAEALADDGSALARELRGVLNPAVTSPMRIEPQAHGKV